MSMTDFSCLLLVGPRIRATVSSVYQVRNMNPEDEDDMVWAKVKTTYTRSFKWGNQDESSVDPGCILVSIFDAKVK